MLLHIDPVLTGELLLALDQMGHTDSVVVADAHFPAARILGRRARLVNLPGLSTPRVLRAIVSVIPPDTGEALELMESPDGLLPVQTEIMTAARLTADDTAILERHAFYDEAAKASLIVRTGETRAFGNALLRKGVVPSLREEQ